MDISLLILVSLIPMLELIFEPKRTIEVLLVFIFIIELSLYCFTGKDLKLVKVWWEFLFNKFKGK